MNKQDAYQFVNHAMKLIFINANIDELNTIYHDDANIHLGEYSFTVEQIRQRMEFVKKVYDHRQCDLHEVVVIDDLIIFQCHQQAIDNRTQQSLNLTLTGTYKMEQGKVKEAWLLNKERIDYLEAA
jgi:hypothetical protein